MSKRKFFSGNSIRQAVIAAASHFEIPPDEVAYREVDKKHGFLKMRKKVIIEVDADDPRSAPQEMPAPERKPDQPARAGQAAPRGASRSSSEGALSSDPGRHRDRRTPEEIAEEQREIAKRLKDLDEDEGEEERSEGGRKRQQGRQRSGGQQQGRQQKGKQQQGRQQKGKQQKQKGKQRQDKQRPDRQRQDKQRQDRQQTRKQQDQQRGRKGGGGRRPQKEDLVELPERSRSAGERFQEAEGEQADATREALETLLDVAGLDLESKVLEGEKQLEVELFGTDEPLLTAEGGELLRSIEHLLRRAARGVAGRAVRLRVNCGDFRELHEERLRSLAQREAAEARKRGKARKLDPMNPADRRIVHLTLQDEPDVTSSSEGRGHFKQVVVKPK